MKQPIFVANFDTETNLFEVRDYDCSKAAESLTLTQFTEFVDNCKKNTKIFINSVNVVASFFPNGEIDGVKDSKDKDGKEYIQYKYNNVTFKSFTVLCPNNHSAKNYMDLFNVETKTEAMIKYIEFLGGTKRLSKTLASYAKKKFYKDKAEILWLHQKKNKVYINTLDEFKMLHAGCKAGLLSHPKKMCRVKNVFEADLKSAYSSVFVTDDKFPTGKPRFTDNKSVLFEKLKNKENVKVVFNKKIDELDFTDEYGISFYDEFNKMTALELYDIYFCQLLKVDIAKIINENECTIIYYDKTGYLHPLVRNGLIDLFDKKNKLSKTDPERDIVKAQLECLYGKAIQKHYDWKSDDDVVRFFRRRGENYIQPQMANHASAYIRYQLLKAKITLGDDVVYFDTDGLKAKDNEITRAYFNKQNELIMQKNKKAGCTNDIGTFEMTEVYDEFVAVSPKIYVYRQNGEINITAAGMDDKSKEICMYYYRSFGIKDEQIIKAIVYFGFVFVLKTLAKVENGVELFYTPTIIGKENENECIA